MTTEAQRLGCPGCGRVWWASADEVLGHRCPACGGMHLPTHAVEQVLVDERGLDIGELRAAADCGGDSRRACASCDAPLAPAEIEGVVVDLCRRCGSVWLVSRANSSS